MKPTFISAAPVSQPHSNHSSSQSLSSGFSEHTFSPDILTQDQPHPQEAPPPLLVFTQSLTGNPTKPTPVYADALSQQFSQSVNVLPPTNTQLIKPPDPTQSINPPLQTQPPTALLFPVTNTSSYTPPSIFTPTPVYSNISPSIQNPHYSSSEVPSAPSAQTFFDYFSTPEQSNQTNTPTNPLQLENVPSPPADTTPITIPPHRPTQPNAPSHSGTTFFIYMRL